MRAMGHLNRVGKSPDCSLWGRQVEIMDRLAGSRLRMLIRWLNGEFAREAKERVAEVFREVSACRA
jgi:hypothetical protein